jgi:hypothetical protein
MQKIEVMKNVSYDIDRDSFIDDVELPYFARYLKGVFKSKDRFKENFIIPFRDGLIALDREDRLPILDLITFYFNKSKPFTYKEAFEIQNNNFRAIVFGSINVSEMIANLGNERINVEGKNVTHRIYKEDGSYTMKNYDVIYELHKINCSTLNIPDNYCVKCWCTSTNKEHWLWIEEPYAHKGALEAIASTIRVYENMIPYIKHIKRQGDVLLFEMTEKIIPSGNIIPLTAEQYFSKLIAQS